MKSSLTIILVIVFILIILCLTKTVSFAKGTEQKPETVPMDMNNPGGNVIDKAPDGMFEFQGDCACRATKDPKAYSWAYLYTDTNQTTKGTASLDQCKAMCALQRACVGFTYDKSEQGCWLIQSPGYLSTDSKQGCGTNACYRRRLPRNIPSGSEPKSGGITNLSTSGTKVTITKKPASK